MEGMSADSETQKGNEGLSLAGLSPKRCCETIIAVIQTLKAELGKELKAFGNQEGLEDLIKRMKHTLVKVSVYLLRSKDGFEDLGILCDEVVQSITHLVCEMRAKITKGGKYIGKEIVSKTTRILDGYEAMFNLTLRHIAYKKGGTTEGEREKAAPATKGSHSEEKRKNEEAYNTSSKDKGPSSLAEALAKHLGLESNAASVDDHKEGYGAALTRMTGSLRGSMASLSSLPKSEIEACHALMEFNSNLIRDARDEVLAVKKQPVKSDDEHPLVDSELLTKSESKVIPSIYKLVQTGYAVARRTSIFTKYMAENENENGGEGEDQKTSSTIDDKEQCAWLERHVQLCVDMSEEIDEMCSDAYPPQNRESIHVHAQKLGSIIDESIKGLKNHGQFQSLPPAKDGKTSDEWVAYASKAAALFVKDVMRNTEKK
mmetsp:Transcript_17790/g.24839  ORF Transcript_17790/g.24839 Transcript_17790/m.24839 type:complete len:430 (-) Transcript_17790:39-1328(-)